MQLPHNRTYKVEMNILKEMGFTIKEVSNLSEAITDSNCESYLPIYNNHCSTQDQSIDPTFLLPPQNKTQHMFDQINFDLSKLNQFPINSNQPAIKPSQTLQLNEAHTYELSKIFELYWPSYAAINNLSMHDKNVIYRIMNCKTATYGYHVTVCTECGYEERNFNTCGDRHCPKCQGYKQRVWIQKELSQLLDVPYYHVVFTLPDDFYPIGLFNKELIYELLFECSSETLLTFGRDPKWLGGEMGFTGILHTWGQTLWFHPHVHYLIPGGGLDKHGVWKEVKHKSKFIFPVRGLSKVFRAKFINKLIKAYEAGKFIVPENQKDKFSNPEFYKWIKKLQKHEWVVYAKRPFGGAEHVVKYIGNYTHRVAISQSRLLSIDNGKIRFKFKNYKKMGAKGSSETIWEEMTLSSEEFIKRFMWHILPKGFHKIRHFGLFKNGQRAKNVSIIRQSIDQQRPLKSQSEQTSQAEQSSVSNLKYIEKKVCPNCQKGYMESLYIVRGSIIIVNSLLEIFLNKGRYKYKSKQ